jgi:hypothetical protein
MAARELKKVMIASAKTIVTEARLQQNHRYKRKGGLLQRSTREEVDKSGLSAKVFLDEGIASYGKYVHEGHGSWMPDRFLYNVAKRQKPYFIARINGAVKRIIEAAGF